MAALAQPAGLSKGEEETATERMRVLGITGGIAMGKSTCVRQLREAFGIAVHDADAAVHRLYGAGGAAVADVAAAMGSDVVDADGGVDRAALSVKLQALPADERGEVLQRLEAIVHPLVRAERAAFVENAHENGAWIAGADVPLLLETARDPSKDGIDTVLVVSCNSTEEQKRRALARPGMTEAKLEAILARQLDDDERRLRADFVVDTSHADKAAAKAQVASVLERLYTPVLCAAAPRTGDRGKNNNNNHPRRRRRVGRVSLDLDDTLWPCWPAIAAAKKTSEDLLPTLMPNTAAFLEGRDPYAGVFSQAGPFAPGRPDAGLAHDITAKRRYVLRNLALRHGDDLRAADDLLEAVVETRSTVAASQVFPAALDLLAALRTLLPGVPLGALTNGNARPVPGTALADALDFWIGAEDIGAPKPRLAAFLAASGCPLRVGPDARGAGGGAPDAPSAVRVSDLVHVGDDLHSDGLGALRAGARAIIVPTNRSQLDLTLLADFHPDDFAIVDSLDQIPDVIRRWLALDNHDPA